MATRSRRARVRTRPVPWWAEAWDGTRRRHPGLERVARPVLDVWAELSRVEIVDRSLALGAQALLALIPLLMVLSLPLGHAGAAGVHDVGLLTGIPDDQLDQLAERVDRSPPDTTTLSVILTVLSATSFSRALARMYARVWGLERHRGVRALRSSVVWLVGWLVMVQLTAGLFRWSADRPVTGLLLQVLGTTLVWWWTAHLLLGGRVPWARLLPGAAATGLALVAFGRLSQVFMPRYTRVNLERFDALGIVFAIATWLVAFASVLIAATVAGRWLAELPAPGPDGPAAGRRTPDG